MDLKHFLQVLRRHWRSMIAIVVLAMTVSAVLTFVVMKPTYESKSRVLISVAVRDTTDAQAASIFANNRAATYADLAGSSELAGRVIDSLDLQMTPEELSSRISAEIVEGTTLIRLTVRGDDPRQTQAIADVTTDQFTDYIAELEAPAATPQTPKSPRTSPTSRRSTRPRSARAARSTWSLRSSSA